jgi:hypothetical protein
VYTEWMPQAHDVLVHACVCVCVCVCVYTPEFAKVARQTNHSWKLTSVYKGFGLQVGLSACVSMCVRLPCYPVPSRLSGPGPSALAHPAHPITTHPSSLRARVCTVGPHHRRDDDILRHHRPHAETPPRR